MPPIKSMNLIRTLFHDICHFIIVWLRARANYVFYWLFPLLIIGMNNVFFLFHFTSHHSVCKWKHSIETCFDVLSPAVGWLSWAREWVSANVYCETINFVQPFWTVSSQADGEVRFGSHRVRDARSNQSVFKYAVKLFFFYVFHLFALFTDDSSTSIHAAPDGTLINRTRTKVFDEFYSSFQICYY